MALQRQITLRNVKGTALTYAEMDQNLSSFFYSASLDSTNLRLHYTGSSVLGAPYTPTSVTVPLNPLLATIQQLTVAGTQVGQVQYRINDTTLGADLSFKWDTNNYRLGVGTPSPTATVHVVGTGEGSIVRLTASGPNKLSRVGYIDFTVGGTSVGSFGKTNPSTSDIYTIVVDGTRSAFTTIGTTNVIQVKSTGVGILVNPNTELTVKGVIGVGSDTTAAQGLIGSIESKVLVTSLPAFSTNLGLLIESPKVSGVTGGHVVVGINQTANNTKYAFSVIAGPGNGSYSDTKLTVTGDGKVGINNANPTQALDIVGNTTMTGNINIAGTATIVTTADSQGANSKVLTVNGSGLVQYSNNLMPLGGIIMWGGTIPSIPTGWKLCDGNVAGSGAPINGVTIPDLRERFIVGAGGATADVATYQYDRTGTTYNDLTFWYYGSPVLTYTQKVNTAGENDNYIEFYSSDPAKVTANGDPTGAYFMYNTGGNYFYYIDYQGKIQKGNAIDVGTQYSTTTTTVNNSTQAQPANWTGDTYFAPIQAYSQAYGFYHVYTKKFTLSNTTPGTNGYWYWIFDKRTQNYVLVRGTFNGDASIGTTAGGTSPFIYKTGHQVGYNYTPFQKYTNTGVPATDANNGRPAKYNARRIQMQGVVWPETYYNVGDTGGFNDVQLTNATMPQHVHIADRWSGNRGDYDSGGGTFADGLGIMNNTRITNVAGGDQPHENRPPYYALAFIIYTGV